VIAVLLASAGCESREEPNARPTDLIVFQSDADGDFEICVMDRRGANRQALTDNHDEDFDPVWSRDRQSIAFCSDRSTGGRGSDLWIMDHDGAQARRLTRGAHARQPAWSPGDSMLVFVSGAEAHSELVLIGVDGSFRAVLTHNEVADLDPAWTREGTLLLRSDRDGDGEIYRMDLQGQVLDQLTDNDVLDEHPTVARDGTRVFYVSHAQGRADVWSMYLDGSDPHPVTREGGAQPTVGLRSDTVAFTRAYDGADEILIMTADGVSEQRLTWNQVIDCSPSW
jgi:TolB protein